MNKKILTLCCVYNETHILLGEKKHGFAKGLYNGFGGKIEAGETVEQAALRELEEESGLIALDMRKRGIILFEFEKEGNPFEGKPLVEVHIYSVREFEGEPKDNDEMRPQWFSHADIPYELMWPDDKFWLPLLLMGKNFKGSFFLKDSKTIISHELEEVGEIG